MTLQLNRVAKKPHSKQHQGKRHSPDTTDREKGASGKQVNQPATIAP